MTLRYLLDTNVVSEPLRITPDPTLLQNLEREGAAAAISSVVWHELVYGAVRLPRSRKRAAIESYLTEVIARSFPILPYDDRAAGWHARERARLASLGRTPSFGDGQIAATAVTRGLTLVTANQDDFRDFEGLSLVDWGV